MKNKIIKVSFNGISLQNVNSGADGDITFSGYGCHFNKINENGEVVDAKSFEKFFEKLKQNSIMPTLNYMHTSTIIGGWDSIEADDTGLLCHGRINKDVQFCKDTVIPLMLAGQLNYLSTEGFCSWDDVEDVEGGIKLNNFLLTAISLVALPADLETKINIQNFIKERQNSKIKTNQLLFI